MKWVIYQIQISEEAGCCLRQLKSDFLQCISFSPHFLPVFFNLSIKWWSVFGNNTIFGGKNTSIQAIYFGKWNNKITKYRWDKPSHYDGRHRVDTSTQRILLCSLNYWRPFVPLQSTISLCGYLLASLYPLATYLVLPWIWRNTASILNYNSFWFLLYI